MAVLRHIFSHLSVGISELKKDPKGVIEEANGEIVAVLNRNEPIFYAVSAEVMEAIMELRDEVELIKLVEAREGEKRVKVNLDDL